MAQLSALISVAFMVGPFVAALISEISMKMPFIVAAVISWVSFVLAFVFLKETHQKVLEKKSTESGQTLAPAAPEHVVPGPPLSSYPKRTLLYIFTAGFFIVMCVSAFFTCYGLFLLDEFGYDQFVWGIISGFISSANLIMMPTLPAMIKRFGKHVMTIVGSFMMGLSIMFIPSLKPFIWQVPALIILAFGCAYGGISHFILASRYASHDAQGQTQGINQSVQSVARVFAPILAGMMYDESRPLPFVTLGAFGVACGLMMMMVYKNNKRVHAEYDASLPK